MSSPEGETPLDVATGGFWDHMGFRPAPPSRPGAPGRIVLEVGPAHLRSLGLMHGGVIAALLDSVMGRAALSTSPEGHHVVTVQLNVHFIKTAEAGDTLTAEAEVEHAGRRTAVVRGSIRNAGGALIATGSGTFLHLPVPPDRAPIPAGAGSD